MGQTCICIFRIRAIEVDRSIEQNIDHQEGRTCKTQSQVGKLFDAPSNQTQPREQEVDLLGLLTKSE